VHDNAIAVADIAIGCIYGITGAGLNLGISRGYKQAWIPGVVLLNHRLVSGSGPRTRRNPVIPLPLPEIMQGLSGFLQISLWECSQCTLLGLEGGEAGEVSSSDFGAHYFLQVS